MVEVEVRLKASLSDSNIAPNSKGADESWPLPAFDVESAELPNGVFGGPYTLDYIGTRFRPTPLAAWHRRTLGGDDIAHRPFEFIPSAHGHPRP